MYFYRSDLLKSNSDAFKPPSVEEFLSLLEHNPKSSGFCNMLITIKENIKGLDYKFNIPSTGNQVTISLLLRIIPYPNMYMNEVTEICRVTLSTVPNNCSSLFISNMVCTIQRASIGSYVLKQILTYAKLANYSFIFCNIAGQVQLQLKTPLSKYFGFKRMALPYKNPRTGNINEWWYTTMNTVEIADPVTPKKPRARKVAPSAQVPSYPI